MVSWGRDFRPDYLSLGNLRSRYTGVPWVLLTAMLPAAMQDDLFKALDLDGARVRRIEGDLNRPKLHYELLPKSNVPLDNARAVAQILNEVRAAADADAETQQIDAFARARSPPPAPAPTATMPARRTTTATTAAAAAAAAVGHRVRPLAARGGKGGGSLGRARDPADFYHAQVEPAVRAAVHRRWLRGETQAIVATSAFGMGVHKADVRVVVHWTLPDSLVSLAQEWGRAGRDGEAARCVLLYSYHDKGRVEALLRRSPHDLRQKLTRLNELLSMCEERCCRRERLLAALGQTLPPGGCGGGCDVCAAAAQLVQEHDVSAAAACASAPSRASPAVSRCGNSKRCSAARVTASSSPTARTAARVRRRARPVEGVAPADAAAPRRASDARRRLHAVAPRRLRLAPLARARGVARRHAARRWWWRRRRRRW